MVLEYNTGEASTILGLGTPNVHNFMSPVGNTQPGPAAMTPLAVHDNDQGPRTGRRLIPPGNIMTSTPADGPSTCKSTSLLFVSV